MTIQVCRFFSSWIFGSLRGFQGTPLFHLSSQLLIRTVSLAQIMDHGFSACNKKVRGREGPVKDLAFSFQRS